MKDIGMEYEAINACPNDHIIYYGKYETILEFPQCGISKYQTNQVTNEAPLKVPSHIPIFPHFQ